MKKRILAALLAGVMLLGLAACGTTPAETPAEPPAGGDTTEAPAEPTGGNWQYRVELTPDNPVTINTAIVTSQMAPNDGNKLSVKMAETLGVTLNYQIIPGDQQETIIGTWLASGEFPELIAQSDLNFALIEGGGLLRLDDMIDSGEFPSIARHVEPFRQRMSYIGGNAPDGDGIYILPAFGRWYNYMTETQSFGTGFFIQKAVLEWAGFPDLSNWTLEQYFDLIEGYMQENETDENGNPLRGMAFEFSDRSWSLTNGPQFLAGHPNNGGVIVDPVTNIASYYIDTDWARRYYEILNDAFLRGLIDVESFTRSADEYQSVLASGSVLGISDQRWAFGNAVDALNAEGRHNRTWVPTMPTFDGIAPWYNDFPAMNTNQGFGIASTAENPGLLMTFLDTMLTQEWQILLSWGIEGEDFQVDGDGMFYRTQEQRDQFHDLAWRADNKLMALYDQLPKIQGTFPDPGFGYGNAWSPGDQVAEFQETLFDYDRMFLESYGKGTWMDFVNQPPANPPYYPAWNIAIEEGLPRINDQLVGDLTEEWVPRLVMAPAGEFAGLWDQFMELIAAIDHQPFLDSMNAGIQQRIEIWGKDSGDWQNTAPLAPLP